MDSNNVDEEISKAIDRICSAATNDISNQVDREIMRYWNDRVRRSGGNKYLRKIRADVFRSLGADNGGDRD